MKNTYKRKIFHLKDNLWTFGFMWTCINFIFSTSLFLPLSLINDDKDYLMLPFFIIIFDSLLIAAKIIYRQRKIVPSMGIDENQNYTLSTAHLRLFMSNGKIDSLTITATLLDLNERKIIDFKKKDGNLIINPLSFFLEKKDIIMYKNNYDENTLSPYEKELINWFINKLGDGHEISSKQLREKLRENDKDYYPFNDLAEFRLSVYNSFQKDIFFSIPKKYKNMNNFMIGLGALGWLLSFIWLLNNPFVHHQISINWYLFVNISSGILMFGLIPIALFSKHGMSEFKKYKAMRKELKKELNLDLNKTPDTNLKYAIALNANKKIGKKIGKFYGKYIYI